MNGEVLSFGNLEVSNDSNLQSYIVVNWEELPSETACFMRLVVAIEMEQQIERKLF